MLLLGYSAGHKWAETLNPEGNKAMQMCIRCNEIGWNF